MSTSTARNKRNTTVDLTVCLLYKDCQKVSEINFPTAMKFHLFGVILGKRTKTTVPVSKGHTHPESSRLNLV